MPDENLTPAPDAADDLTDNQPTDGLEPQPTNDNPEPNPAEDELDAIDDMEELERRLAAADQPKKPKKPSEEEDEEDDDDPEGEQPDETASADPQQPVAKNFRLKTTDPKRAKFFQLLKQNPDADVADLAKIAGLTKAEVQATQQEQQPAAEADTLKPLRDKIAGLKAKRKELRDAYEHDQADVVNDELTDAQLELERETAKATNTAVQARTFQAQHADAVKKANAMYPEAVKPGTRQHQVLKLLAAAKTQEDPEFFNDPSFPLRLIAQLEKDFPEVFPKRTPQKPNGVTAVAPVARPVGQAVSTNGNTPRLSTKKEIADAINNLTPEQLYALGQETGTKGW